MLRPGGMLILRDHDVTTPEMFAFVSLAHTVFNAGLGVPWETNRQELRYFVSVAEWVRRLQAAGFADTGQRLLQAHDPSDNVLMAFVKEASVRIRALLAGCALAVADRRALRRRSRRPSTAAARSRPSSPSPSGSWCTARPSTRPS